MGALALGSTLSAGGAATAEPSAGFPLPPEETAPPPPPLAAPPRRAVPPPASARPPRDSPPTLATPAVEPMAAPTTALDAAAIEAPAPPPGYPLVLPYRPGVPVPRGYHVETRPATGLLVTGGVTLAVSYLGALGIGLHHDFDNGTGWTALPVVGPWAAIGAREFDCQVSGSDLDIDDLDDFDTEGTAREAERCIRLARTEAISIALLAVDGMIQATGAIVLIAGLASGRDELVWDGLGNVQLSARRRPEGGAELQLFGEF